MKRLISLLLVLVLLASVVVGCTKPADEEPADSPEVEAPEETPEEDEDDQEVAEGEIVKLGLGHNISIAKSRDAEDDKTAQAQSDLTAAAVGFDADGKVVSVTIDVAQTRVEFDEDLKVASDKDEAPQTKKELKEEYGMLKASEIEKEWFQQMEAFEEWMIGKTVDEIKGLEVKEVDENHKHVPDVPELTSSVTITVESYIDAVVEAWDNAVDVAGGETVGLGMVTSIAKSADAEEDKNAAAAADTTMAATAFDADGNVVGTIIDVAQVKVEFDEDGKVTSDKSAEIKTKHELKEEYGMVKASEIGKEWFEQMEAFQEWMVGKSLDEITGLEVKEVDERHQHVPDVPELTSSVTITVESYLEAVEEAHANKK